MQPRLTERDIQVLTAVYKYRYMSFSQIARFLFPSLKTAYRRVKLLTEGNYLKAFSAPALPERIFHLDREGAPIVAAQLHVDVTELEWYRFGKSPKDYLFLRHFLAINDFRILITRVSEESPVRLLGFIPEYLGTKTPAGNVKKYIRDSVCDIANTSLFYSHTPDAVFSLEKDGNAALFFLEIDRGTEIVSDTEKGFLKCIVFYLNYWVDKKWQRYQEDFGREFKTFRTLIITTSKDRLQHMREATTKLPFADSHAKRFLWGTTQENATAEWLLESIWHSMDSSDHTLYTIG